MLIDQRKQFVYRKSLRSQVKWFLQILYLRSIQNHTKKPWMLSICKWSYGISACLHGKIQISILRIFTDSGTMVSIVGIQDQISADRFGSSRDICWDHCVVPREEYSFKTNCAIWTLAEFCWERCSEIQQRSGNVDERSAFSIRKVLTIGSISLGRCAKSNTKC